MSEVAPKPSPVESEQAVCMRDRIARWISVLVVAGILAMGAAMKFANGGQPLAEHVPGGVIGVMGIGVLETLAVVLLLIPRTSVYGAVLAAVLMLGAIGSHLGGIVPMDGEFEGMIMLAVIAFLAASLAIYIRRGDLPFRK